ncbi:MAG: metallophosphoesterase [Balneolaceae bacterium]|nr:metallophosphoesterase [Balneolaceae bacterium]
MLIGLISDTHDHVPHIKRAVELFRKRQTALVLHAGDYCSPFTIPHFEGLNLKGIFGNNDGDKYLLLQKCNEIDAELYGDFMELQAGGLNIAVYHGTHQPITRALRRSGNYDVVVSGHTHSVVEKEIGNTLAVNPGTAHGFDEEATAVLLETESRELEIVRLD